MSSKKKSPGRVSVAVALPGVSDSKVLYPHNHVDIVAGLAW